MEPGDMMKKVEPLLCIDKHRNVCYILELF